MFLKKLFVFGLFAAVLPAVAEEAADRKTATSLKYVEHELSTRQNKFTAEQNKAMEYTNSAGDVQKRTVKSDLGTSTSDTSLPMVGGVNTKLNQKQDDIDPINDHTAVTYTGTAGTIGQKGIYQATGTYAEQSDNLIDAKTFNAALKKGLDSEFLCSEYKPGTDLCWVWAIHNNEAPAEACPNLLSAAAAGTVTQDGITVVSDGHGIYTITGTATRQTDIYFNVHEFTVPTSVGHGGTGSLYFGNSATYDGTYFLFGYNNNQVDTWGLSGLDRLDRFVTQYSTMENRTVNQIGFRLPAGQTYNMTMRPAVYNDGRTSAGTFVSCRSLVDIPYTTLVPAGYTPVEYLRSDGLAYINTNYSPTSHTRIEITAKMDAGAGNVNIVGSGRGNSGASTEATFTINSYTDTQYEIKFNSTVAWKTIPGTTTNKNTVSLSATEFKINGAVADTNTASFVDTGTQPIYIFQRWRPNITSTDDKVQVYGFKIFEDDILVQNLIPAKQGDVAGMYDTVNKHFLPNAASTGGFTAGPDINNIIYVPQNQ